MVLIKNRIYTEQNEFADSLEKMGTSTNWFSYLCAKDEGITEIGLFEKIYFVIGGWLHLIENQTSEEKIDATLCEILDKNLALVNPEQFPFIYKIAVRANLIKNDSKSNIQAVADEIYQISDIIRSLQEESPKKRLTPEDQVIRVIIPDISQNHNLLDSSENFAKVDRYEDNQHLVTISESDNEKSLTGDSFLSISQEKEEAASKITKISQNSGGLLFPSHEGIEDSRKVLNKELETAYEATKTAFPELNLHDSDSKWSKMVGVAVKLAVVIGGGLLLGRFFSGGSVPTDLSGSKDTSQDLSLQTSLNHSKHYDVLTPPSSLEKNFSKLAEQMDKQLSTTKHVHTPLNTPQAGDNALNLLVKKALMEKWKEDELSLDINKDDLIAGITLLTEIAMEAIAEKSKNRSHEISFEDELKAFIENNVYEFERICKTGFPFSLLESSSARNALKKALENYESILFHFMTSEDHWMSEMELNERFSGPFQRLHASEIVITCSELQRSYFQNEDNKAGYYLLWLIKQTTGCDYEIPEKESFNDATVSRVLSQFLTGLGIPKNPTTFVDHTGNSRLEKLLYIFKNTCQV